MQRGNSVGVSPPRRIGVFVGSRPNGTGVTEGVGTAVGKRNVHPLVPATSATMRLIQTALHILSIDRLPSTITNRLKLSELIVQREASPPQQSYPFTLPPERKWKIARSHLVHLPDKAERTSAIETPAIGITRSIEVRLTSEHPIRICTAQRQTELMMKQFSNMLLRLSFIYQAST